ncbi:MAG TPA: ABC transporter permease [Pyrinomonadaceae bacterium]|nr:ABC transporter permease [Pyrinomonadaceae bacterium]
MRRPRATPFAAIFRTEVMLNLRRPAPYALLALFCVNALMWWGWGAAAAYGWATNGDFYIIRNFSGFSFMTLPLFTALMMGDPVIRDFRARVDPLIFSTPTGKTEYLLAKFSANYFVLLCCQAGFMLTLVCCQAFERAGMIVVEPRLWPYLKHFLFFVVVSNLALAALYFTVGTLTRSAKAVYALATSFYLVYISWQLVLKNFPPRWRIVLDPLLFNWSAELPRRLSTDELNRVALEYDGDLLANRAAVLLFVLACFLILRARFSIVERAARVDDSVTTLGLAERAERIYFDSRDAGVAASAGAARAGAVSAGAASGLDAESGARAPEHGARKAVVIPETRATLGGVRAGFKQFAAALGTEFRLLGAERGLAAVVPMAALLCGVSLAYYDVVPRGSYSAAYAYVTADSLLMLLFGVALFYTGETLHRDRELRVEPLLWSAPAPDAALLLSKFSATLLLSLTLVALVALVSVFVQIYKGHTPVEASAYLKACALVVAPSAFFMTAAVLVLNVLLRDKHLTYAVGLALGGALFYLFTQGYNHWLYNPLLYGLWSPEDLGAAGDKLRLIALHRVYWLALAALCLALAHFFFGRRSSRRLLEGGKLTSKGWALVFALACGAAALVAGLGIYHRT